MVISDFISEDASVNVNLQLTHSGCALTQNGAPSILAGLAGVHNGEVQIQPKLEVLG